MAGRVDWEAGDKLILANHLSQREIARQLGCSEKAVRKRVDSLRRAGKYRDLSARVQERVRAKMVRSEVRKEVRSTDAGDDEIAEEAAEQITQVLTLQRRDIDQLAELERHILAELMDDPGKVHVSAYQGTVTQTPLVLTAAEKAQALLALAGVQHKRIQLQRQALGMGDDDKGRGDLNVTISQDDAACL